MSLDWGINTSGKTLRFIEEFYGQSVFVSLYVVCLFRVTHVAHSGQFFVVEPRASRRQNKEATGL